LGQRFWLVQVRKCVLVFACIWAHNLSQRQLLVVDDVVVVGKRVTILLNSRLI
jgi:hypothetical protein